MGCLIALALPTTAAASAAPSGWAAPHRLSSNAYAEPQVATNAAGASIVVWQAPRTQGSGQVAAVATRDAGSGWSASRQLTVAGRSSKAIFAGVGGSGRDVMVWAASARAGGATHVLWSQRPAHREWTAPRTIPNQHVAPSTFFLSSSGWGVVAYQTGGVGYVRVLTPAGHWRAAQRVTPLVPDGRHDAVGRHVNIRAVIAPTGAVTASWTTITVDTRSRTAGNLQRGGLSPAGKRLAPVTLAAGVSGYGTAPHLWASASGRSVALQWMSSAGEETIAFRLAGGRWQRHVATGEPGAPTQAAVALTDRRVAMWWQSWTSTRATLYAARYQGGSWSTPSAVVSYDDSGPTSFTDAGAISDQLAVLGWTQYQVTTPEGRHDSAVRTAAASGDSDLPLGPWSVVRDVAANGSRASVVWIGKGGLFVQTR